MSSEPIITTPLQDLTVEQLQDAQFARGFLQAIKRHTYEAEERGYQRAIAELRDVEAFLDWYRKNRGPNRTYAEIAADYLEYKAAASSEESPS